MDFWRWCTVFCSQLGLSQGSQLCCICNLFSVILTCLEDTRSDHLYCLHQWTGLLEVVYCFLLPTRLVSKALYCVVIVTYWCSAYLPRRYQVWPLVLSTSMDFWRWCTAFCSRLGLSPRLSTVWYSQPSKIYQNLGVQISKEYHYDPKFSDRYAWANSFCHSVCIFWNWYSMAEPHC